MSDWLNPLYANHLARILPYVEDPEVEEIAINDPGREVPKHMIEQKAVPSNLGAKFADADGADDIAAETAAITEAPHEPTLIWRKMKKTGEWEGVLAPEISYTYLDQLTRIIANINGQDYAPTRTPITYASLPGAAGNHRFTAIGGPHVRYGVNDVDGLAWCIRQGSKRRVVELSDFQRGNIVKMTGKPIINAPEWAQPVLEAAMEGKAIILVGLMSSGKTSLLTALASYLEDKKRIGTLEDTREIHLDHKNRVPLWISRNDPINNVSDADVIKAMKRLTFEVLIFGEMSADRGPVVREMLGMGGQAFFMTQHSGSTVDGYRDTMMFFRKGGESDDIIHDVIQAKVGYFIHCSQQPDGSRAITGISTPAEVLKEVRNQDRRGFSN